MALPPPAARVHLVDGAVYSKLAQELAAYQGETWPFHVGDTWRGPPAGCEPQALTGVEGTNRYTAVPGWGPLIEAVQARVAARTGHPVPTAGVYIAAGATAGLHALVLSMVDPGRTVLILSPAWPLLANMVRLAGGEAVHVPILDCADDADALIARLEAAHRPSDVAVYLNSPNNPSGRNLSHAALRAIAAWAQRHDLYILADEVYEDYVYDGQHLPMRSLAPEHTVAVHSFSKGYGMAGYRVGYLVGPPEVIGPATRLSTYTYYCAPFPGQVAALRALGPAGETWVAESRASYQEVGRAAAARLGVPAPQGGTFLFVDVSAELDDQGIHGLLGRCVRRGLLLAPGPSFGPWPSHLRLCFTAVDPARTLRGVDVLAEVLGR